MQISWSMPGQGAKLIQMDVGLDSSALDVQHAMEAVLRDFRDDLMRAVYGQVRGGAIAREARN